MRTTPVGLVTAGIVVAAIEQQALPPGRLVRGAALHEACPPVDVVPAAAISDREVVLGADRSEQVLEVDLLDLRGSGDRRDVDLAPGGPQVGREAAIFKYVFKHSIILACLVGAIVMLYAFAIPGVVPAATSATR